MTRPEPAARCPAPTTGRCQAVGSGPRVVLLGLLGLALAGLPACGRSPAEQLARARGQIERHERHDAVVQLKSLLQDSPSSGEARWLLGGQLLALGDAVAAVIELRRALELGQPEVQVVPLLAQALVADGQHKKLVEQYGALTWPDARATADLKAALAQAQASLGDLPGARGSLALALQAVPDHLSAQLLQARVLAVAGDSPAALRAIDALLARHPASADAWLLKGDLLARSGADPTLAVQAWRQSLARRPDHPAAHTALIAAHLARGEIDAAQSQFDALRKVLPQHPQTRLFEGQIALARGDLLRARELFQALLKALPDDPMLLQAAAVTALRLQAPAQAEGWLSKALQLAPASASARRLLAQSQLALGQPARALAVLEPLLGAEVQDAQALALAAQARLLDGNPRASIELFERAAKVQPGDPRIRTAAALSRLAGAAPGQADSALAELQSVAATDAGSVADLALLSAQLRRKDLAGALLAIAALERKQPGQPLAPHLRGQVLLMQRDEAGARAAFEQAAACDAAYFPPVAALADLDWRAKRPDAAQHRLAAWLKTHPDHGAARLALADLARRGGASREAVADLLAQAVAASPADPRSRLALIDHHLATHNPQAALLAAQAALAQLPDHLDLLQRLGRSQLAAGNPQQAISTYNRMLVLQGHSAAGAIGLAEAQLAANDPAAASLSVKQALLLLPDSLAARRLGISAALRQRQTASALQLAREAQRRQPEQAAGFLLEAEVHIAQQQWASAAPVLRRALGLAGPAQAAERLHQVLQKAGKPADAEALATAWRTSHPDDAQFVFYLGDAALAQGDLAAAEQRYQAVLKLLPEHALSLNNIAWLMLAQGKPGALAYAERAVAASPGTPALMDTLALAYAADQQVAKAIDLQKKVLQMRPADPFVRLNLARFYVQAGEKRLAKAELDRLQVLGERFARQAEVAALAKGLGGR